MVQGLVAQSNGCLVLKSRLGEGTTAEIWLPVASQAAGESKAEEAVPQPGVAVSLTVLLVVTTCSCSRAQPPCWRISGTAR